MNQGIDLVDIQQLIHGDQYLICDDIRVCYLEKMNEVIELDGYIEHERDLNGMLQVLRHILSILVLLKFLDGIKGGDDIEFIIIICPMSII